MRLPDGIAADIMKHIGTLFFYEIIPVSVSDSDSLSALWFGILLVYL